MLAAALAVSSALAAYPLTLGDRAPEWVLGVGLAGAGVGLLSAAFEIAGGIGLGVALLVGSYALAADELGSGLDERSLLWAAGLFLVAELLFLASELRSPASPVGALVLRRLGAVGGLALATVVAGAVLLALTGVGQAGGVAAQAAGVAAVAGAIGLLFLLPRR